MRNCLWSVPHLKTLDRENRTKSYCGCPGLVTFPGGAIHGRPWLPSHFATLTNEIGLQLYMRPVNASKLAGPDGICGLTPDYPGGL